jgi:hypothetical protein
MHSIPLCNYISNILTPIVTAKVEEELATATNIVESLRIVGVIEDEA